MSKYILLFLFLLLFQFTFSQGVNFQGVARSANGTILASTNISLRLSIISKNVDATPEYIETKTVVTNSQGIFSVVVGDATNATVVGGFKNIDWSDGPKFLKVEMDPVGASNFINMGATKLQYVPYAFYSYGVDASGVKGILPVEKGGTGVGSLDSLKSALKIINFDTTSLSNRIDAKVTRDNAVFAKDIIVNGITIGTGSGTTTSTLKSTNSILGYKAFENITSGQYNTAIGFESLSLNTTGDRNTAIGANALSGNTTGRFNTALGRWTLGFNTTGDSSLAIGYSALIYNTTGSRNIAAGRYALQSNVGNSGSTAIGYDAMRYADNRIIGRITYNTAIGYESLKGKIGDARANTGIENTAVGYQSLFQNISGNSNTAIGNGALTINTIGNNNTAIGSGANVSTNNLSNSTAIGYNAQVTASNQIQLGDANVSEVKTSGKITAKEISTTRTFSIGELYGGGVIFYVTPNGLHGLIAETVNQSEGMYWESAVNAVTDPSTHSTEGQNFTDWRLPSKVELDLLYLNRSAVGISTGTFWSSFTYLSSYPNSASDKNFSNGSQNFSNFGTSNKVRAIRTF
jgi:hypothetical protein